MVSDRFPELAAITRGWPDGTVVDGEILAYNAGAPLPFSALQTRIGRKKLSPKLLEEAPVVFMAYDILELAGRDVRGAPLAERRAALENLESGADTAPLFMLSAALRPRSWNEAVSLRESARSMGAEGLMLKRLSSPYETGRRRGNWWKWKLDPFSLDAVLIYAQKGHGKRAGLYTDYTFGIWRGQELVPFAKAYSGLTDSEIAEVDRFVKASTVERFGPIRSVKPELVFEIGFESIQRSKRHRSGFAVRFPRMLRWRRDKPAAEAADISELEELLEIYEGGKASR